ncbi:MAG TPA: hypothetical protein VJ840_01060 [Gemmatimonadaceae bacterium]|nr:hypothetical protein [Gemmatimonadaceae bacterium]
MSSSPGGAYVVRPGTSAALTARTIDATPRPVLSRAQESVTQVAPQIADSFRNAFSSPLFLSALGLTLIFAWILSRMRRQLSGLAMGVMLVIATTSFTAPHKPKPQVQRVVDLAHTPKTTRNRMQSTSWNGYGYIAPRQVEEPTQVVADYPSSYGPDSRYVPDPVDIVLPATPVTPLPELRDELMRNVEREAYRLMQDPQVREIILRLRAQAREEARHRRWRRDF